MLAGIVVVASSQLQIAGRAGTGSNKINVEIGVITMDTCLLISDSQTALSESILSISHSTEAVVYAS